MMWQHSLPRCIYYICYGISVLSQPQQTGNTQSLQCDICQSWSGASAEVKIQLFNSKYLPILYYGIDVCPLTNTQINSLQFVINSCYTKIKVVKIILMIQSSDDIRYSQDVFGCLPVADFVERRTAIFLKKYKEANDNNIVCQTCIRY